MREGQESFIKGKPELFLHQVRCGGNAKFVSSGENEGFSEFCKELIVPLRGFLHRS